MGGLEVGVIQPVDIVDGREVPLPCGRHGHRLTGQQRIELPGRGAAGAVETAVSLAKILDNPRAVSQLVAAAGKLADIMDTLHKGPAARRGGLKLVRAMADKAGGWVPG